MRSQVKILIIKSKICFIICYREESNKVYYLKGYSKEKLDTATKAAIKILDENEKENDDPRKSNGSRKTLVKNEQSCNSIVTNNNENTHSVQRDRSGSNMYNRPLTPSQDNILQKLPFK